MEQHELTNAFVEFGDEYREYQRCVPMLFPRFRSSQEDES